MHARALQTHPTCVLSAPPPTKAHSSSGELLRTGAGAAIPPWLSLVHGGPWSGRSYACVRKLACKRDVGDEAKESSTLQFAPGFRVQSTQCVPWFVREVFNCIAEKEYLRARVNCADRWAERPFSSILTEQVDDGVRSGSWCSVGCQRALIVLSIVIVSN